MMQGARRAHIHWSIFNRRATPQDGMHRFPNADVFLGQDTIDLCSESEPPSSHSTRMALVPPVGECPRPGADLNLASPGVRIRR
jgi:hypothetical protein